MKLTLHICPFIFQMYFEVKVIQPTRLMATSFPPEVEAVDGNEVQFTVEVSEANPTPTILWFLNTGKKFLKEAYHSLIYF